MGDLHTWLCTILPSWSLFHFKEMFSPSWESESSMLIMIVFPWLITYKISGYTRSVVRLLAQLFLALLTFVLVSEPVKIPTFKYWNCARWTYFISPKYFFLSLYIEIKIENKFRTLTVAHSLEEYYCLNLPFSNVQVTLTKWSFFLFLGDIW